MKWSLSTSESSIAGLAETRREVEASKTAAARMRYTNMVQRIRELGELFELYEGKCVVIRLLKDGRAWSPCYMASRCRSSV